MEWILVNGLVPVTSYMENNLKESASFYNLVETCMTLVQDVFYRFQLSRIFSNCPEYWCHVKMDTGPLFWGLWVPILALEIIIKQYAVSQVQTVPVCMRL